MMSIRGTWHLGDIQRPTDRTRARLKPNGGTFVPAFTDEFGAGGPQPARRYLCRIAS